MKQMKNDAIEMIKITDWNISEMNLFFGKSESALRHCFEPEPGVFIAESPNVIERALHAGYEPIALLTEEGQSETERVSDLIYTCAAEMKWRNGQMENKIQHYVAPNELMAQITGYPMTRGALCAFRRRMLPSLAEICQTARRLVVLEDVMNPTNLGAIFRSAAALNMDAVIMTAGCTDPLYRRAARVSMGTVFQIPWTCLRAKEMNWPEEGIETLHRFGFKIVSMALRKDSVRMDDPILCSEEKLAIIMGTEAFGLSDQTLNLSDYTVKIPMSHGVDSLNVAAASAIAFWELGRRRDLD